MVGLILVIAFWEFFLTLIPLTLAFFLYRKLRRKHKVAGISVLVLIIGIEIYRWVIMFNPTNRFYQQEFVQATGFALPKDVDIIAKKSNVPWHLHSLGYEATFLVKCNNLSYLQLMQQIQNDTDFSVTNEVAFWSDWRVDMLKDNKLDKASIIYIKRTPGGKIIYIEFFARQNLLLFCEWSV